jgi:hypothetical protein
LVGECELNASFGSRPRVAGSNVLSQPLRIDARECGLAEVHRPLNPTVTVLAERRQIPWQQVPLVTVQVVDWEEVWRRPVLDPAEFTAPASVPPNPP